MQVGVRLEDVIDGKRKIVALLRSDDSLAIRDEDAREHFAVLGANAHRRRAVRKFAEAGDPLHPMLSEWGAA